VLSGGDAGFQKECLGKMGEVAREGRTVLFVGHNVLALTRRRGGGVFAGGSRSPLRAALT